MNQQYFLKLFILILNFSKVSTVPVSSFFNSKYLSTKLKQTLIETSYFLLILNS